MRIKVAAIAKDEGAYIPEWIFHHLHFKFDAIEIWVNDTTDSSIEILNRICVNNSNVKYHIADELLLFCQKNKLPFQIEAYKKIFYKSIEEGFTHLIFLDLDELWMPRDFKTGIIECLESYGEFDAVSFQWHLDSPNELNEFELAINRNLLQKYKLVKTAFKLEKKTKIDIHNHLIENGLYKLSDGSQFNQDPTSKHNRAAVSIEHLNNNSEIDEYFIHHSIYRSKMEYLSSLAKGLKQVNGGEIKNNRWGYLNLTGSIPNLKFDINHKDKELYLNAYSEFISENSLLNFIENAKIDIFRRYQRLLTKLKNDTHVIENIKNVFLGTDIYELLDTTKQCSFTKHYVDSFNIGKEVVISGWLFLNDNSSKHNLRVLDEHGCEIEFSLTRSARPDVKRKFINAPIDSGFTLKINLKSVINNGSVRPITIIVETEKEFGFVKLFNGL
ncbi:glycosyltransferase family 2 protein [Aeromonas rivipollensis]|uniref:glycosyltransferase family 2 protein n=1 Tax=Aeromonas rivipollensis TaxID=948519 RepID=UPI0013313AB5|nr:glycosyltransferase family 2 protein [Aeromonas rivipollensis]